MAADSAAAPERCVGGVVDECKFADIGDTAGRKAFGADLPAIIVTADTDPTIIRSMVDRGIAVHFKPLQIATLQAFILQATQRKSP